MKKNLLITFLVLCLGFNLMSTVVANNPQNGKPVRYLQPTFEKIVAEKDIEFGEVTNFKGQTEKLLLDVYSPEGDTETHRPVILWFHGGGFRPGNDKRQDYIVKFSKDFARRGYVCISINYRIRENPKDDRTGTMSDALKDAMSGLEWIRANHKKLGVDPSKIIVGGGSAGGMLTVNFGFRDGTAAEPWDKTGILGLVNLWGSPEPSYLFSVIDKNDPPMIMVHGTEDKILPFDYAVMLDKQLTDNHVRHELIRLEGAGHTPMKQYDEFAKKISAFVYSLVNLNK